MVERILAIEKGILLFDGPLDQMILQMDEQQVLYRLEASDREGLLAALADIGLAGSPLDNRFVQVSVPTAETAGLLSGLIGRGVELLEARRETENLEGAYLRLLEEDSKPS